MTQQQPEIVSGLIWRMVDDNVVVVSPTAGDVHVLSPTGTVVWQMIADNQPINEIVLHLSKNFEVGEDEAKKDVDGFIQELLSLGLLTEG